MFQGGTLYRSDHTEISRSQEDRRLKLNAGSWNKNQNISVND